MDWSKVGDMFGKGIDFLDHATDNFNRDDLKMFGGGKKEEIANLQGDLAVANDKAKKSEQNMMYVVGGVILLMVMGIIKIK